MKLFAAQFQPTPGDVDANLNKHLALIELGQQSGADLICFPELSLTGYEPSLLSELGNTRLHPRMQELQAASDRYKVVLAVGLPIEAPAKPKIGMLIIQPNVDQQIYCKQWLHSDEYAFFTAGDTPLVLSIQGERIAPAICFESKQPEHLANVLKTHPSVYLTSVASDADGVARAQTYYAHIAKQHQMAVLMANFTGPCDSFFCAGQSAIWDQNGHRQAELGPSEEGLAGFCTTSQGTAILRLA